MLRNHRILLNPLSYSVSNYIVALVRKEMVIVTAGEMNKNFSIVVVVLRVICPLTLAEFSDDRDL